MPKCRDNWRSKRARAKRNAQRKATALRRCVIRRFVARYWQVVDYVISYGDGTTDYPGMVHANGVR